MYWQSRHQHTRVTAGGASLPADCSTKASACRHSGSGQEGNA
jgi:hypothetical protein